MSVYTLQDSDTGEEWEENCKFDELAQLLENNPSYRRVWKPVGFVSIHGSVMSRTDGDFRDHLKSIKKKYPGNTIDNS